MCFFFSSRRRHTRCSRDWSSDVCSSDLELALPQQHVVGPFEAGLEPAEEGIDPIRDGEPDADRDHAPPGAPPTGQPAGPDPPRPRGPPAAPAPPPPRLLLRGPPPSPHGAPAAEARDSGA